MGNRFPILVCNEARRLDFSYTRGGKVNVTIWNPKGVCEFEKALKP